MTERAKITGSIYSNDFFEKKQELGLAELKSLSSKNEPQYFWEKCLVIIKDNVSQSVFRTWFEPIKAIRLEGKELVITVPSQFFFEWIEEHYYDLLKASLHKVLGADSRLLYEVMVDSSDSKQKKKSIKIPAFRYAPSTQQPVLPFSQADTSKNEFQTFLHPRFTLENFIVGDSNQLAHSAANAVASKPGGTKFNPLFIYGGSGMGKTHLAQAIGNHIIRKNPKVRVLYTVSERFTMEFVDALKNQKMNDFINFYRGIDVLIIEDIQFFAGKEKTQDNFFHTFNALLQAGKQIILTSDKPPRELKDVNERLISRFQWGLTVDIQAPDLELRMAILKRKCDDEGIEIPDEIVEYLARNVTNNIRELEGAFISLLAKVTLDQREMSLDLAKESLYGLGLCEQRKITLEDIMKLVTDFYDIPVEQVLSKSRKHEIVLARQMSMYLSKYFTTHSLKVIGEFFGNRDHSTVLHAYTAIENYLSTDKKVKLTFENFMNELKKRI
ncbi:MAG: chromosomal replication initiator protein DnaA [Candidatus Kapabacteria bacterium]|nr:chromosomal replication initiator protein DnaA [Candidatus Kapabacteria bacterium]